MPPRHLPFALILCRHSEFSPFLWLTSLPLRAASSSPHIAVVQPLDLIASASRESGAVAKVNFHVAEIRPSRQRFDFRPLLAALGIAETAFRSALVCTASYRAMGSLLGGVSAYSEGARWGKGKTSVSAVGGVQSHYGGKPP